MTFRCSSSAVESFLGLSFLCLSSSCCFSTVCGNSAHRVRYPKVAANKSLEIALLFKRKLFYFCQTEIFVAFFIDSSEEMGTNMFSFDSFLETKYQR